MSELGKQPGHPCTLKNVMLWRSSGYRSKAASYSCSLASLVLRVVCTVQVTRTEFPELHHAAQWRSVVWHYAQNAPPRRQYLDEGSQAVGGAGGVGDDGGRGVELLVVDADDVGGDVRALGGGCDQHLLGACGDVLAGTLAAHMPTISTCGYVHPQMPPCRYPWRLTDVAKWCLCKLHAIALLPRRVAQVLVKDKPGSARSQCCTAAPVDEDTCALDDEVNLLHIRATALSEPVLWNQNGPCSVRCHALSRPQACMC